MYRNIESLCLCTWNKHGIVGQLHFNKTEKKRWNMGLDLTIRRSLVHILVGMSAQVQRLE